MIQEKSCGVIVRHTSNGAQEYLLLHYPQGHWDFPKGHVEQGESEQETALRELLEETGIEQVALIDGFREQMKYMFTGNGQPHAKQVVYFLATSQTKEVRLSHEHKGYAWLPYQQAKDALTFKNAKELLDKAHAF